MRRALVVLPAAVLAACNVGPRYQRPNVQVPDTYRNQLPGEPAGAASLADEKWWAVFQDAELQKLIRTALEQNYDVRLAAARISQAQARVGLARADQLPSLSAGPGYLSQRLPGFGFSVFQLQALSSWNPDFWGRYRSATEAARASLLAAEWDRREVVATLVQSIAIAYFQLRELDLELEIARRTLGSREESLKLTQTLLNGGAAGLLDVRQAEHLVQGAAETIPDVERQIAQQEDLISTLTGERPHDVPRGLRLTEQPLPPEIPAGLPSQLLERRPDIRRAEQQLIAANASITVARSALFPSLPLTLSGGFESAALKGLFAAGAAVWTLPPALLQPIFTGGRLRANVQLSEAQQQQAVLVYQQTIQQAFQEVSDALIAFRKYREFREHQELLAAAAQDASRLSDIRYRGGAASYLEVLTSETNYFAAELSLSRARLNERLSLVRVYAALGGGWEQ